MHSTDVLLELYHRIPPLVRSTVDGLDADLLNSSPEPGTNSMTWLLWHVGRVQDAQVAELAGEDQRWVSDRWNERFGLPPDPSDTGFGHSSAEAGAVRVRDATLLTAYADAVADLVDPYLRRLDDAALDVVIDDSFDPPVTAGVRLSSIVDDCLQHLGQAAYVRGLLEARC